jgi:hypothetical protein
MTREQFDNLRIGDIIETGKRGFRRKVLDKMGCAVILERKMGEHWDCVVYRSESDRLSYPQPPK